MAILHGLDPWNAGSASAAYPPSDLQALRDTALVQPRIAREGRYSIAGDLVTLRPYVYGLSRPSLRPVCAGD